jgi:hypothetical protein
VLQKPTATEESPSEAHGHRGGQIAASPSEAHVHRGQIAASPSEAHGHRGGQIAASPLEAHGHYRTTNYKDVLLFFSLRALIGLGSGGRR